MTNVNTVSGIYGGVSEIYAKGLSANLAKHKEDKEVASIGSIIRDTVEISDAALEAAQKIPPANDPKQPTLEDLLKFVNGVFDQFDADGSGVVDSSEFINQLFGNSGKIENYEEALKGLEAYNSVFLVGSQGDLKLTRDELNQYFTNQYNGVPNTPPPPANDPLKLAADSKMPTLEEFQKTYMPVFHQLDADGNGIATSQELIDHFAAIKDKAPGDNVLSYMTVVMSAFNQGRGDDMQLTEAEAMKYLETAYNQLSAANVAQAPQPAPVEPVAQNEPAPVDARKAFIDHAVSIYQSMDENNDGEVTVAEINSWLEKGTANLDPKEAAIARDIFLGHFKGAKGDDEIVTAAEAKEYIIALADSSFSKTQDVAAEPTKAEPAIVVADAKKSNHADFFKMLNKDEDEYVTLDEFKKWLDSIKLDNSDRDATASVKKQALDLFQEAMALLNKAGILDPNQQANSINFKQYEFYLTAKGVIGGNDSKVA